MRGVRAIDRVLPDDPTAQARIQTAASIFSQTGFAGDFVARGTRRTQLEVQKKQLEVQQELLDYIKENNLAFG